jgi:polyisoprenoid-binding protein YceI
MNKFPIDSTRLLFLLIGLHQEVYASDYVIDTEGGHAYIQFKISHLGFSWLTGRFNRFSGEFSYDENNPSTARVVVAIDTGSIDSNHAERDEGKATLVGDLTLRGVTRPIHIDVEHMGAGSDPWGGYRRGFSGKTPIVLADFGISKYLGASAKTVALYLGIEGIRKKSKNTLKRPSGFRNR